MKRSEYSLLLLVVALGCAKGEAAPEWAGTVTDSAGIPIVVNPTSELWTDASRWTVTEELKIGSAEDEPDYQFVRVAGIAVGSDGRIYVMDQGAQQVRVFTSDGTFDGAIGGPGGGPGEFGAGAGPVLMGLGDTLLVPDLQQQRVNRYAPDGTSLGSYPMVFTDGLPLRWDATPSGVIVNQLRPLALPNQPATDSMDLIAIRDTDGSVTDTLMRVPSGKTISFASSGPEITFFVAEPVWALTPDAGILFGVNNEYRIGVYSPDGTLTRVITKPSEPMPVGERDRTVLLNAMERLWKEAGVPAQALDRLKSAIHFADNFPAYLQFLSGPQNTVWVQGILAPSSLSADAQEFFNPQQDLGSSEFEVFDAEGRYLGVVTMPDRFTPLRFEGDVVYGIWRDELDVQYVVRLRIGGMPPA
ncbi:MAG TPA: 6-bladed beta-propeller [Gemmatimonadales bacterium]|nr:6-bladed beta-propeller [Gemmatimonadales bacterium]